MIGVQFFPTASFEVNFLPPHYHPSLFPLYKTPLAALQDRRRKSCISHTIIFLLLLCTFIAESADSIDPLGNYCNENTIISNGSKLSANIGRLLAELVQKTPSSGFFTATYGKDQDQVYGLAQCRGDVSNQDCSTCIEDAAKEIRQSCPDQADARIWYDFCFLRYNNKAFIGEVDTSVGIFYYNVENVTDPQSFNKNLGNLVDDITKQAAQPDNKGLGKGKTKLSPFVTLYALVQCTRDLSQVDCAQCLAIAVSNFDNICSDRKGCRVLYSSCYVRYELYPFFFPLDHNNTEISKTVMVVVYP